MKKIYYSCSLLLLLGVGNVLFTGCEGDDIDEIREELQVHDERITALENWQKTLNTDIQSLSTVLKRLQDNDYVTDVSDLSDGSGYVVTFQKGAAVTIRHGKNGTNGVDGKDAVMPQIGVKLETDGRYYWTLNGEDLLDADGHKVPATGAKGDRGEAGQNGQDGAEAIVPLMRIDNATDCWEISEDGGKTWQTTHVKATGAKGDQGEQGEAGQNGQDGQDGQDAIAPQMRINEVTDEWEISVDGGLYWLSTGVKATGAKGDRGEQGEAGQNGADGQDGQDGQNGAAGQNGVVPQFRINPATDEWEVSLNNGQSWQTTHVKATGEKGETGKPGADATGEGTQGPMGPQGPEGPAGPVGPQGPTGPQGPQGPAGSIDGVIQDIVVTDTSVSLKVNGQTIILPRQAAAELELSFAPYCMKVYPLDEKILYSDRDIRGGGDISGLKLNFPSDLTADQLESIIATIQPVGEGTTDKVGMRNPFECNVSYGISSGKPYALVEIWHNGQVPFSETARLEVIVRTKDGRKATLSQLVKYTAAKVVSSLEELRNLDPKFFPGVVLLPGVDLSKTTSEDFKKFSFVDLSVSGITSIPDFQFSFCTDLKSVFLPESCTSIGEMSFWNLGLTEIDLSHVKTLNQGSFYGCNQLKKVKLGNGITRLPMNVFNSCTSLTELDLPSSVTEIDNSAFNMCWGLKKLDLTNVTKISSHIFTNCQSLTYLDLSKYKGIPNSCAMASGLESVKLGAVDSIGDYAFAQSFYLTHTEGSKNGTFLVDAKKVGSKAFSATAIQRIEFSDRLETLGENIFQDASYLRYIVIRSDADFSAQDPVKLFGNVINPAKPRVTFVCKDPAKYAAWKTKGFADIISLENYQ